ncbi:sensor histidine kinase [Solidesulfovibrio sp.]|uniref:sensor histidine kinase n=1 Tax=Solidesulfovibrio sp. TaxID=2910990 RepID=UPI002B1E9DD6|nr:ATP-binding protein [Solidesulfovibrio sp.]MEA5088158.1 ATP-binding protein [Solidesulfovibrio sp.]HML61423.1 ATP-binding protein [Solidesulfovibrio sp.]
MVDAPRPHDDAYCVFDAEDREYLVGVVGAGPGFDTILEIVAGDEFREFLPPMHLAGVAGIELCDPRRRSPLLAGVPFFATYQELFAHAPHINLVVALQQGLDNRVLSRDMPPGASLIDSTASFFLCALSSAVSVGAHCRRRLDHQKLLLEAIVDEVQEDIALIAASGRVVDLNRNVVARLGRAKEDLVGRDCRELRASPEDPPLCDPDDPGGPFRTALATGEKAERLHTAVAADGRLRYYRTYTYPIRDASGQVGHVVVFRRDITDRTMGEISARQAERIETVGRLSSYLAHEIRNPLFAASGFARRLSLMDGLPESAKEKAGIVLEELTRMEALLKQFLEFARPVGAVVGQADVERVAREAVQTVGLEAETRRVGLSLDIPPGLPAVTLDPALLKQCLVNLLRNAVEDLPHGGLVSVAADRDGQRVRLRVADSGRGATREHLENMFSPFYKGDHCEYGLGLAMVKKVVDDFGGAVEAAGQPGGGCVITLFLPPVLAGPEDKG